jgi:hypothetical protein
VSWTVNNVSLTITPDTVTTTFTASSQLPPITDPIGISSISYGYTVFIYSPGQAQPFELAATGQQGQGWDDSKALVLWTGEKPGTVTSNGNQITVSVPRSEMPTLRPGVRWSGLWTVVTNLDAGDPNAVPKFESSESGCPGINGAAQTFSNETATTRTPQSTTRTATSAQPPSTSAPSALGLSAQVVGGVHVDVPQGWTQLPEPNAVYGDHTDYLFVAASDPSEQLLVVTSDCVGCYSGSSPASLVPTGSTGVTTITPSEAGFAASGNARSLSSYWSTTGSTALASGYETNGVAMTAPPSAAAVHAMVAVTLPASLHSTATQILNSARIS